MLQHLSISNYALIQELTFSPSENMNAITGETGAGKSILLGALGLLLGKRADTKTLLNEEKKCVVEGSFNISDYNMKYLFEQNELDYEVDTIIRREIAPNGKSRAFINDTPVNLEILKDFGNLLMDVHSQHDNLLLGELDYQRYVIDSFAQNVQAFEIYQKSYSIFKTAQKNHKKLIEKQSLGQEELDFKKNQLLQLQKLKLNIAEFQTLEEEVKIAENAQEIKTYLYNIIAMGSESEQSVIPVLKDIQLELKKLCTFSKEFQELDSRLESAFLEIKDIIEDIQRKEQHIEFDEEQAIILKEKYDEFNSQLFKHRVDSAEELIAIQQLLKQEVVLVDNLDLEIETSEKKLLQLKMDLLQKGKLLTDSRKKCLSSFEKELKEHLSNLGMPNAAIQVLLESCEPNSHGVDKIEILFSANKGIQPQSLKKTASGGEFSRLLFCIKYILASKTSLPTIVFDEIDTGVSGEISKRMGQMMRKMANHHQIIAITHLPQVAALANKHFFVYKSEKNTITTSEIKILNENEREIEIAKMLSGDNPTEAAFQNAKELLSLKH